MRQRGGVNRSLGEAVSLLAMALLISAAALSGSASAPAGAATHVATGGIPSQQSRPYASLPTLGPAPQRCFPYGSSDNICTGPNWPYPPNANYLYATYYGTVYISPHVVGVGQDITATAVSQLKGVPSWNTPPGPIVAGCKGHDETCTWKATGASTYPPDAKAPGGGWSTYGMTFCGFFGCAESEDFYYVLPKKRAISGIVTAPGTNVGASSNTPEILPVPDAVIKIAGAQSGTAATDANGFYDVLVDPGRYRVSVGSIDGQAASAPPTACAPGATQGNDCIVETAYDDASANFDACPGEAGTQNGVRALASAAAATPVRFCPLQVSVARLEPTSMSGLSYQGKLLPYSTTETAMTNSPAFVRQLVGAQPLNDPLVPGGSGGITQKCMSGCTDFLVTVRDTKGAPIPGAKVIARVTPITKGLAPYPQGVSPGGGFLCAETLPTKAKPSKAVSCYTGDGITESDDVETDDSGHVLLQYWAPGLILPEKTVLIVSATTVPGCRIGVHLCQLGGSGKLSPDLVFQVQPDRIYSNQLTLKDGLPDAVAKWADPPNFHDFLLDPFGTVVRYWTNISLKNAIGNIIDQLPAPISRTYDVATYLSGMSAAQQEQIGLMFKLFEDLGLSPFGLDDTETSGYPPTNQIINSNFLSLMTAPPTQLSVLSIPLGSPTALEKTGMMWQWGVNMNPRAPSGTDVHSYQSENSASIQVYEVSFCQQATAVASGSSACQPGYSQSGQNDLTGLRAQGIQPYLYLDFDFQDINPDTHKPYLFGSGKPVEFTFAVVVPYNAAGWMQSQFANKSAPPP